MPDRLHTPAEDAERDAFFESNKDQMAQIARSVQAKQAGESKASWTARCLWVLFRIVKFLMMIGAALGIGAGFVNAGVLGALTGFLTPILAGSGLMIALAGTDTTNSNEARWRFAGVVAAIIVVLATYRQGWRWGWLYALIGYVVGSLLGYCIAWALRIKSGGTAPHWR